MIWTTTPDSLERLGLQAFGHVVSPEPGDLYEAPPSSEALSADQIGSTRLWLKREGIRAVQTLKAPLMQSSALAPTPRLPSAGELLLCLWDSDLGRLRGDRLSLLLHGLAERRLLGARTPIAPGGLLATAQAWAELSGLGLLPFPAADTPWAPGAQLEPALLLSCVFPAYLTLIHVVERQTGLPIELIGRFIRL